MEDERTTHNPYIHRTLADGFAKLIFHYKGTFDELTSHGEIERSFLENKLSKNYLNQPDVFSCINDIIQSKGVTDIKTLADRHFLSLRQFERKFKHFSGFSPKLFSRIIRFQSAIKRYDNKKMPLTEIAYDCGYYDQSHFMHDFKEFSGYHPMQYFSGGAEGVEYKEV